MASSDMIGDMVNRFENVEDGRIFSEDEEDEPHVVIRYVQKVCSICKEKYVDNDGYDSESEGVKYVMADAGSSDTAKKGKKKDSGKTKSSGKGREDDSKKKNDTKEDKTGKSKSSDVDEACVEHRKRDQVVKSKLTKQQSDAIEESLKEQVKTRDQQKMVLVQQPAGRVQVKRAKRDHGSQEEKENEEGNDSSDHVRDTDRVDAEDQHEYSSIKRSDGDGEEDIRRQDDRNDRINDNSEDDEKTKETFRDQDKKENYDDDNKNQGTSQEENQKRHKRNKSETKSYDSSTDKERQSIRGDQEDEETRKNRRDNDNGNEGDNYERARRRSNESGTLDRNYEDGDHYKDQDEEQKIQNRDHAQRQKSTESKEDCSSNEWEESDQKTTHVYHSRNSSTVQGGEEPDHREESKYESSKNRNSELNEEESELYKVGKREESNLSSKRQESGTDSKHSEQGDQESGSESMKKRYSEQDEEVEKTEGNVSARRKEGGKNNDEDDKSLSGRRGSSHSYRENDSETGETRGVKERTRDELQDDIVNQDTAVDDGLAGIESGKTGKMVTRYIYHNVDEPRHTGNSLAEEDKHDPHALSIYYHIRCCYLRMLKSLITTLVGSPVLALLFHLQESKTFLQKGYVVLIIQLWKSNHPFFDHFAHDFVAECPVVERILRTIQSMENDENCEI